MRRLLLLTLTLGLAGVGCVPRPNNVSALSVLDTIPVAAPNVAGYDRSLFGYPADADHDHCDTRAEVLIRDSLNPIVATPACTVISSRWVSGYDGVTTTSAAQLQIDHVVAFAEAWASGASKWPEPERLAFGRGEDRPDQCAGRTRSLTR
jgi:hypothetical protein